MVPPGDVTAARNDSGLVVAVAEQRRRAEERLTHELLARVAREPDEHAGFDHRLGDEEHVRRTRAREAGDRVELRLGHAHDDADAAEHPLAQLEVELGHVLPGARSPRHRVPTSAPVLGIARTTGRPGATASSAAMVTPAAIDSTSAPSGSTSAQLASAATDVGRLHREHQHLGVGRGPRRAAHDAHAGQARLEGVATVGVDLGDRELLGFPSAVEQADRERFAHATAAQRVPSASAAG